MPTWTNWLITTAAWAIGSCIVVALIWGPDPGSMAITAGGSVLLSLLLGNGGRS